MNDANKPFMLPERSALFSLVPIGIGTSGVESLESYVCRLALQHGVPRRTLERYIHHQGETLYLDVAGPPRLDCPSKIGRTFAERLARLTLQPAVLSLGLNRFEGAIADMHTLRRNRAWCGCCFHDARVAGVPAHLPLLWSFACYPRCIIHDRLLETECRACKRRSDPSNSWSRAIDHCPWCNADLATDSKAPPRTFAELAWKGDKSTEMRCGQILATFVAQASMNGQPQRKADLQRVVDSATARGVARTVADLTRRSGLAESTLYSVLRKGNAPALTVLMRVATAAGVSMYGVLDPSAWCDDAVSHPAWSLGDQPRMSKRRHHDWPAIRQAVVDALARGEAEPAWTLARRLGVDATHLRLGLGDLHRVVIERAKAARADRRQQRFAELVEEIRAIRQRMLESGQRPSAGKVSRALNRPLRNLILAAAYKQALVEP